METAYEQQAPLLGGTSTAAAASTPLPLDPDALAPAHFGTLPLALLQHPSLQLTVLAFSLLLALQTTAPVAAAWAALAAVALSAFLALTTHAASGGGGGPATGPRARNRPAHPHPHAHRLKKGPTALASLTLEAAALIALLSWLACWAWADPPGREFWLRWMPALVLAFFSAQLLLAAVVGFPPARALLVDKSPPLLLSMDLPVRPVAGSPAFPPWLASLAREVTLAWGLMAGLAAASCAVPAATGRHAFAGGGGKGGEGGGGEGGEGGGTAGGGEMWVDGLDVAFSVCVPLALGLAALAIGDALCERARRAHLPRMMAAASRAQAGGGGVASSSGAAPLQQQQEAAAPPSGVAGLV